METIDVQFENDGDIGCLSNRFKIIQGTQLLAAIELCTAIIITLYVPEFLLNDGHFFYLRRETFIDYGRAIFGVAIFVITSCIITIVLLVVGIWQRSPTLMLFHLIWQLLFLPFATTIVYFLFEFISTDQMLRPSGVVFIIVDTIIILVQLLCMIQYYRCYRLIQLSIHCRRLSRAEMRRRSEFLSDDVRKILLTKYGSVSSIVVEDEESDSCSDDDDENCSNLIVDDGITWL